MEAQAQPFTMYMFCSPNTPEELQNSIQVFEELENLGRRLKIKIKLTPRNGEDPPIIIKIRTPNITNSFSLTVSECSVTYFTVMIEAVVYF